MLEKARKDYRKQNEVINRKANPTSEDYNKLEKLGCKLDELTPEFKY